MHLAKDLQHFFECRAPSSCRSVFVPFIGGNFQNGRPRRAISFSPVGLPRIFRTPLGAQVSVGQCRPPAFWGRRCGVSVATAMEPELHPICRRRLSANRLLGRFWYLPGVQLPFGVSRNRGPSMAKLS